MIQDDFWIEERVYGAVRFSVLLPFLLLITSCAVVKTAPDKQIFDSAPLPDEWQLDGRIGIQQSEHSWHASFHWSQQDRDFQITLRGPLGQIQGRVIKHGMEVMLIDGNGQRQSSNSTELDELVRKHLGIHVPINYLSHWILGRPHPGRSWRLLELPQGRPQGFSFTQADWEIHVNSWREVDGHWLPARMLLQRNAIQVRLVIRNWAASAAPTSSSNNAERL